MLAGRKLLLADDSITIQKVVDLTFTDEGATVLCVNNGREASERLEEFLPDVVLADVFMPEMTGYELCEYIKQNDKLKHIPVMLLVGSFEPFDEEEARKVGANDTLTKPFQSIRRLIEKVGLLASSRPPEEQIPTAELPKPEDSFEAPVEKLTTAELEMTTADTQPLPPELRHVVEQAAASQANQEQAAADDLINNENVESRVMETSSSSQEFETSGEVLLDLEDFKQTRAPFADDFVLDIDLDEIPEPSPAEGAFSSSAFRSGDSYQTSAIQPSFAGVNASTATVSEVPVATTDQFAETQEFERITDEPEYQESSSQPIFGDTQVAVAPAEQRDAGMVAAEPYSSAPLASSSDVSLQQLSPEMIDAIARRAVEYLSEKVIQEIAWEVVPQLAELLIKRQLEEKNS
ncbi:MAG TPA: response regulator [Pyrinomonadaceae bacterium]|nr:response regulator [Pyrinomonadaceae bacterium]